MNIALWVMQGILAVIFGMSGAMKAFTPKDKLSERMEFAARMPESFLKLVGILELMGMAGLFLPGLTGILPILTPIAAVGLILTMIGAIAVHLPRQEYPNASINLVLLLMAAFVAYGRLVSVPL